MTRISDNQRTRQVAAEMNRAQEAIAAVREQLASGKRINRPSDDPAQAARLVSIDDSRGRLEQYGRNADAAESRLSLEEGALSSVNDSLARVRDLALAAGNGTSSDRDRDTFRLEITERLGELYEAANTRDASGDYLFGGSRTSTRPFDRGDPTVFNGDTVPRELPIGSTRRISTGDSGADAFMNVPSGNGRFAVEADSANTGGGVIAAGSVTDPTAFREANYRIEFTSPTTFDVIDADANTTLLAAQSFADGASIVFEGISTSVSGSPAAGDVFHVSPSVSQDLFGTVARLEKLLATPVTTPVDQTRLRQGIDTAIVEIDNALDTINAVRGRVGARLQAIDSARDENEGIVLQLERTATELEDVDIADAVTRLESRAFALEALQKSWMRVENLSLFNYL